MKRPYPKERRIVQYTAEELKIMHARKKTKQSAGIVSNDEEAAINRGIALDKDIPELTAADFAHMRPAHEVVPGIVKAYKEGRLGVRGPQRTPLKVPTTIRLSPEVLKFFKSSGRGWQSRIDAALKEYTRAHHR